MKPILVYADSLTWGIIPDTRLRLPFEERWPQFNRLLVGTVLCFCRESSCGFPE